MSTTVSRHVVPWADEASPPMSQSPLVTIPPHVIEQAAQAFGVTQSALLGHSMQRPLVEYRQVAMYVVRHLCGCSYPVVGLLFDNRDHTTVRYACLKVAADPRLRALADGLVARVHLSDGGSFT